MQLACVFFFNILLAFYCIRVLQLGEAGWKRVVAVEHGSGFEPMLIGAYEQLAVGQAPVALPLMLGGEWASCSCCDICWSWSETNGA